MAKGQVIRAYNGFYYVETAEGLVSCKLRGKLKRERCGVAVGDFVELGQLADGSGIIERRLARESFLLRPPVANVRQVVLTFAAGEPAIHPLLLNRFLVLAECSGIPEILICVNKIDLLPQGEAAELLSSYEKIGYALRKVSAREGRGLDALRERLSGKVTVFAGPSGVGKSSLLNALSPGLALATGQLSERIKRGRHTTRIAQLLPYAGGYIVDTPGFSAVGMECVEANRLDNYFPEFAPFLGHCRYQPCSHSHEPGCAVKQAAEDGAIFAERYAAYRAILQEIAEGGRARGRQA